jgi:hypothetical protein
MVTTNNWAIFAEKNKSEWHFGSLSQDFIENTVSFLNGLDSIGKELFGSGVASIELDWRNLDTDKSSHIKTKEVFVVSLFSQFFFIASDPLTTIKLIEIKGVPEDIEDIIRGVLVGQASVLYSNLYLDANSTDDQNKVDELFRSTIIEVGITENLDDIVDKGRCSFASFSFSQMLIFHYLLRKIFSQKYSKSDEWGIVADSSGSPIYIAYGKMENTTSLSGYLSVLLMFCVELFKAPPKSIVFGGEKLIPLEMVNGSDNNSYCAFSAWEILFKEPEFLRQLIELDHTGVTDLQIPLSNFLGEKLSLIFQKNLQNWKLELLISVYQNIQEKIEIIKKN